jgi:hypothetical protein
VPNNRPNQANPASGHAGPANTPREPLNDRQRRYLDAIYELDQQAERDQARRWRQNLRREPADTWRWIPYDQQPTGEQTPLQHLLAKHNLLDHGAGATLAALARRGLVQQRRITPDIPHPESTLQLRITSKGRGVARAMRPAGSTQQDPVLPGWLHLALTKVAESGGELPKTAIGRVAARRLGPGGLNYIADVNAWAYTVTAEGATYLAGHQDP